MGRIVLAAALAGWGALIATPGVAQTNEACMLRCLDHLLYQACHARCTKGEPAPSRAATPTNVPPAASTPPSPPAAASAPPSSAQPAAAAPAPQPSALQPTVAQPAPEPNVEPAAEPAANQAPPPRATQQSVKPPAPPERPVNEACVLRCLEHGRLDQQCETICAK